MNTHDAWEQIHRKKNWGGYPSEHIIRFVARNYYVMDRHSIRILDFGCGTGSHTWYLAREGFDTYAFDISETAIEKLRQRLYDEGLIAKTDVCDGVNLKYSSDFFDSIIDNVSIQSNRVDDIKRMYKESYRVLKNHGKLITVVFDKDTTGYGTGIKIEEGTYEGVTGGSLQGLGCRHFFDREELTEVLCNSGFKNVLVENNTYTDKGNIISQLIAIGEKDE